MPGIARTLQTIPLRWVALMDWMSMLLKEQLEAGLLAKQSLALWQIRSYRGGLSAIK